MAQRPVGRHETWKPDTKTRSIKTRDLKDTPYSLVAAIDFGSTFSGYAFSTKFDHKLDPLKVSNMTWTAKCGGLLSLKTSSCILFDPTETFDSFGFDAEDKYADLMQEDENNGWFLFRRFKMTLYYEKEISRGMKLKASNGKEMSAMKVFTCSIRFLKDHLLDMCKLRGVGIDMSEIRWILTMPAIWNDRAKQFMRECAEQAGIPGPQLILSLEAEAAALFCKYLPLSEMAVGKAGNVSVFKPGAKYLVLDVGGGTVDITVHEVQDDLRLKELYMANGGEWGGTMVDSEFIKLLSEILGDNVVENFKKNNQADFLDLQRTFEAKKRTISSTKEAKITFILPISLLDTFNQINPKLNLTEKIKANSKFHKNLTWKMDKMRLNAELAKELFSKSVKRIVDHVIDLLHKPEIEHVQAILLVGGYSECPLLQEAITKEFPKKRLVIPQEAGLAVLKGAVVNGHELEAVTERISRLTYGVGTNMPFNPGTHEESRKFKDDDGKDLCRGCFCAHVRYGESVPVGLTGRCERYWVMESDQTELPVYIYTTKNSNPKYIDEEGCEIIGEVIVEMKNTERGLQRGVDVEFTFGGAEIEVTAYDIHSREEQTAYFNFLG
ncbi:heat shock 70 kDa protein 12A-like [Mizuhopecten yessoensis]|uniref:Heat shock 70 kDa protein n=1 Tax=Mizuhopecten yessoensis TaxID=6573 RepID=A0A1C9U2X9_MIZYE|nr:heat shock 70 kDa protein 12A-like [Mizuhopecten yessoensis]AOR17345.1 heat shock 70 kDa protein [Mizuhopecten yessoensis]OWF52451.1 Heat shock 70 kDa protein 12B [Mizuhopecten yessoensis]